VLALPGSFVAKALFHAFSVHGKGHEVIALSYGYLALAIGSSRRAVAPGLAYLEKHGLIEKFGSPSVSDQVQAYRMLHPLLVRREQEEIPRVAKEKKKIRIRACVKCNRDCVPGKTGWCPACSKDVALECKIARKVDGALNARGIIAKTDCG
jgi:hypothetical protein